MLLIGDDGLVQVGGAWKVWNGGHVDMQALAALTADCIESMPGTAGSSVTVTGAGSRVNVADWLPVGGNGMPHDYLLVLGGATLGGGLSVSLLPEFIPDTGDSFAVPYTTLGRSGTFDPLQTALPALGGGLEWRVDDDPNEIRLSIVQTSFLDADLDEEDGVDATDLGIWKSGFGLNGSAIHTPGDANGDQVIDGSDFLVWQRQFRSCLSLGAASSPAPEPADATLVLIAAMLIAWFLAGRFSTATRSSGFYELMRI